MLLRQRRLRVAHWEVAPESRRRVTAELLWAAAARRKPPVGSRVTTTAGRAVSKGQERRESNPRRSRVIARAGLSGASPG